MNRAQTIADCFRVVGVELTPERAEEIVERTWALAKLAGAPVSVGFSTVLIRTDPVGHRITFTRLED